MRCRPLRSAAPDLSPHCDAQVLHIPSLGAMFGSKDLALSNQSVDWEQLLRVGRAQAVCWAVEWDGCIVRLALEYIEQVRPPTGWVGTYILPHVAALY